MDNGGCDHYCTETIQSYICSCYPGYTLDTDQHTCIGKLKPCVVFIDYILASHGCLIIIIVSLPTTNLLALAKFVCIKVCKPALCMSSISHTNISHWFVATVM